MKKIFTSQMLGVFRRTILLISVFTLLSLNLSAKDKIEFTWLDFWGCFYISATNNKPFTVNWGDGTIETLLGSSAGALIIHEYVPGQGAHKVTIEAAEPECKILRFGFDDGVWQVSSLAVTDCSELSLLSCPNNKLTELYLSGCLRKEELMVDFSNNQSSNIKFSGCSAILGIDCSYNKLTNLDFLTNCPNLGYLHCSNNQLSKLNLSNFPNMTYLACSNNQLSELNLTKNPLLAYLYCDNNKLTKIDLLESSALEAAICCYNRLQLSDLYALHLLSNNDDYKYLGPQTLPATWVTLDTELFADQSEFDGKYTKYVVEKGGNPAPESDYTVKEGKLTFHTRGLYTVTMTNDAIVSNQNYPAEVIATLDVVHVGISENSVPDIKVYPNPTTGELRIENGELKINNVEIFDIYGRKLSTFDLQLSTDKIDISHLPAGIYFLRIDNKTVKVIKQ